MVEVQVNGQERKFEGDPSMPLMWFLRDELGLTGTKFGCGVALCGACTVHLDGEAVRSCGVAVGDVAGKTVITIEALDADGNHPVQKAWRALNVPQCGYCQAGQIMQAAALLAAKPNPSDAEITDAMTGNICRWSSPTSSRPIGRACASSRRRATRSNTATRTPTARAAYGTSSSRCGNAAPPAARCWKPSRPSAGASLSARSPRSITRWCTKR